MKKALFFLLVLPLSIFGQEVDEQELQSAAEVEFLNFEGPQPRIYEAEIIRGIGRVLSQEITRGESIGWYADKYSALHTYDPSQPEKLGADIIAIEAPASVNHIDSLRLILAGFLEEHYQFNRTDARVLALFTTYYNAVHRGDMAYFSERFQTEVQDFVDEETAGLARTYRDWPGKSRILIPLTAASSEKDVRSLDTTALTEKKVIQSLQEREDRGVDERKQMVDIKEREVDKSREELEKEKELAAQKQKELETEQRELEEKQRALQAEEDRLAEKKKSAERIQDDDTRAERLKEIEEEERKLDETEEGVEDKKLVVEDTVREIDESESRISEEEKAIAQKEQEIAEETKEIKRDERIIEAQKDPEKIVDELEKKEEELKQVSRLEPIAGGKLYYLKVKQYLTDGHYANDLYVIDALTGEFLLKAPEKPHLAGHKYDVIDETGVLVLTQGTGRESHHLSLLDLVTLEPLIINSETDIFHLSFIELRGDYIYTVNFLGTGDYRLGKYNKKTLELIAVSVDQLDKNTVFHKNGDLIFVNSRDLKMLVLNDGDLSRKNIIDLP